MSEFKVGDKVVVGDGYGLSDTDMHILGVLPDVTVVTIKSIKGYRALFHEFDGQDVWQDYVGIALSGLTLADTTQQKRTELKAAIELVQSYGVATHPTQTRVWCNGDATDRTVEGMLDLLLPLETPAQKKLKELEQQQLAIAAQMEELRSSL
jgi:hypothetical protein